MSSLNIEKLRLIDPELAAKLDQVMRDMNQNMQDQIENKENKEDVISKSEQEEQYNKEKVIVQKKDINQSNDLVPVAPMTGNASMISVELTQNIELGRTEHIGADAIIVQQLARMTTKMVEVIEPLIDINKFDVLTEFKLVSDIDPYIVYVSGHNREGVTEPMPEANSTLSIIMKDTRRTFQPGMVFIRYGLNQEIFGKDVAIDGVPLLKDEGIKDFGYISKSKLKVAYLNGLISIITAMTCDNRIVRITNDEMIKFSETPELLKSYVSDRVIKKIGPHVTLAAVSDDVAWVNNVFRQLEESTQLKYHLGYVESITDSTTLVSSRMYYDVNVDQYTAEIVNSNLQFLLSQDNAVDQLHEALKAYSSELTQIDVSMIPSLTLMSSFNGDRALSSLLLGCIMSTTCIESIMSANELYFSKSNIFRNLQLPLLMPSSKTIASASEIQKLLTNRLGSCDYMYINRALAGELLPSFSAAQMSKLRIPETMEGAIVNLVELYLYNLMFPNQFESIKGLIANHLIDCLKFFNKPQVTEFLRKYGYKYRRTPNGGFEPIVDNIKWNNERDYLSEFEPSFFRPGLNELNGNIVYELAKWFKPIGENVSDSGAISAEFPRLMRNPTHYIPFRHSRSLGMDDFSSAVAGFVDHLFKMIENYRRHSSVSSNNQSVSMCQEWLNYVKLRAGVLDPVLHGHVSLLMRSRVNSVLNFVGDFKGNYSEHVPLNYVLLSENNMFGRLYRTDAKYVKKCATRSTAVVWHLLFNSTSIIMDQQGNNATGITATLSAEKIYLPDPGPLLMQDLKVLEYCNKLATGVGLVSCLFSRNIFADEEVKAQFLSKFESINLPNSTFNELLKVTLDRMNVDVGEYGRIFLMDGGRSSQRSKLIDPIFRRIKHQSMTPEDYDEAIDPVNFRDIQLFMSEIEIKRFLLGLNFVIRSPIMKLHRGLRLAKQECPRLIPDYKPEIPDGVGTYTYTRGMFHQENVNGVPTFILRLNGVVYDSRDNWPRIHLIVPHREKIPLFIRQCLLIGIEERQWILDLPDVIYVPKIEATRVQNLQLMKDIMNREVNEIEFIPFADSSLSINQPTLSMYPVVSYANFIFPMTSVTGSYCVSCYGNVNYTETVPDGAHEPTIYDFDTGTLIDDEAPCYSMTAYRDVKKTSLGFISLSNRIIAITKNVDYATTFDYSVTTEDSLIDFIDENNFVDAI